jgi:hypothetical protein
MSWCRSGEIEKRTAYDCRHESVSSCGRSDYIAGHYYAAAYIRKSNITITRKCTPSLACGNTGLLMIPRHEKQYHDQN